MMVSRAHLYYKAIVISKRWGLERASFKDLRAGLLSLKPIVSEPYSDGAPRAQCTYCISIFSFVQFHLSQATVLQVLLIY